MGDRIESGAPKVTVILFTYNHERWIAQAVDSVLMQRTDFRVEVIVADDCSTDRTREILRDCVQRHPGRLTLRLNDTNKNDNVDWLQVFSAATGDYIAVLDGDDYWTSPEKLRVQARFLDEHPECSVCAHNAWIEHVGMPGQDRAYVRPGRKPFSTLPDILVDNFLPTCGVMLRGQAIASLPAWVVKGKWLDWSLYIAAAFHGSIGYIDEVMAVYRRHPGGMWSGLSRERQLRSVIDYLEFTDESLERTFTDILQPRIRQLAGELAQARR